MDGLLEESENGHSNFPKWLIYCVKGLVGTACCLSILGASLIIFTYIAFPQLRTTLRQILVSLSLADLLAALANLVGLCINFYRYLDPVTNQINETYVALRYVCQIQGGVSVIGTLAAITWTVSMAVYMFMFIVLKQPFLANKLLPLHYILSWGGPILLTFIFGALGWLGFEPHTTPGYCDVKTVFYTNASNASTNYTNYTPVILRYSIPVDVSVVIIPPIFIIIRCYLLKMVKKSSDSFAGAESAVKSADKKLIFVPVIFIMLRIWNVIADPIVFFCRRQLLVDHNYVSLAAVLFKGLGFSLQGFFNAILYIGFTDQVRNQLIHAITATVMCCCPRARKITTRTVISRVLTPSAGMDVAEDEQLDINQRDLEKKPLLNNVNLLDEDSRGFYRSL